MVRLRLEASHWLYPDTEDFICFSPDGRNFSQHLLTSIDGKLSISFSF